MFHHRKKTGFPAAIRYLIFFLFFLSAAPAVAAVYYVDIVNGSDTNLGTSIPSAWKTIHYAVSQLQSGDVLTVLPGTYIQTNGESDTELTITTANIQILGSSSGGVILDGSIAGEWTTGLIVTSGISGILIQNLEIKNFSRGIRIEQDVSATIQGCNIHNNTTDGIQVIRSSPIIQKNTINDNNGNGVSVTANITSSASPEILENIFKDNYIGIYVYADSIDASPKIINNLIYEYVSGSMNHGVWIRGFVTGGTNSSEIYHNTIDGGTGDGIYLFRDVSSISPSIKFNNITNFAGYGISDNGTPSSPTIEYNNVYNNASGNYDPNFSGSVSNDINLPPQYNNSASGDYHLQSSSPCVNAIPATAGDTVIYDLDGVDRTLPALGNKDIGCYEFLPNVPLNISISPSGAGTVTGVGSVNTTPANCADSCIWNYIITESVQLTATAATGYQFSRWDEGGTQRTANPDTITINGERTITGVFTPASSNYTLSVSILPPGSGSVTDTGITCPDDCSETAFSGSTFSLLAAPNAGFVFDRWEEGGIIKTDNPNAITLDRNTLVSAVFVAEDDETNSPPEVPTAISPVDGIAFPEGTGSITLQTSPFSDPDNDSHSYTRWLVKREDRGFYFNEDYHASFDYIAVSSPDLTRHNVSGLSSGMAYIWKAGYADSKGKISWSEEYRFLVGNESQIPLPQVPPGVTVRQYRMISFPIWSTESACRLLFGPAEGGYDIKFMRIGTWDATSGSYLECDDGLPIKPGRAYWILARNGLDVQPSGIPVTTDLDVEVGLQRGWNMIACPNDKEYTWLNVEVLEADPSGGTVLDPTPVRELPDTTVIDSRLWRWENGGYADDTEVMRPYEGYWIRAFRENLFLKFSENAVRAASSHSSEIIRIQDVRNTKSSLTVRKASGAVDIPPMPMGIDSETEKGGCFISILNQKTGLH